MWTEDEFTFSGKYYSVDKPINEPKGVRKPHPSLWIGGGGEKVTLKLVAQYGDAANVGGGDPDVISRQARDPASGTARRSAATTTRSSSPPT